MTQIYSFSFVENILDIPGADQPFVQLSDNEFEFVESGEEDYNIVGETYDTLDSVPSEFEPNVRYKKNIRIDEMVHMPPTDVENSEVPESLDLIYDTLESVPPQPPDQLQSDSSLWKPPIKTTLVPLIQIPTISTMGKQISSTYSMLSVDEQDIETDVGGGKARPESCYSLLDASEIEENSDRPPFPLPPFSNIPECLENSNAVEGGNSSEKAELLPDTLPEYTEIDTKVDGSIEEVIYDERIIVDRSDLNIADYEDPSSLTLPPPSKPLNLSDIKKEDFPSYDTTFQLNQKFLQETTSAEYSKIVLPTSLINPNSNSQPTSEYDILNDAQEVAQQIPDRNFITKSESLDILLQETTKLQHLMSVDLNNHDKDEQDMEKMKAELDKHLSEFSDIRDLDVSLQVTPTTEQENAKNLLVMEDLYASPKKIIGLKETGFSYEDSIPSVEDIYAGVEPPTLPISSVNLAEDLEDIDPSIPPPPPRTFSLNNQLTTSSRPKFPEPNSLSNSSNDYQTTSSKDRETTEVDYSTIESSKNPDILHTTSLESPEEPMKRTLSKREKKDMEKICYGSKKISTIMSAKEIGIYFKDIIENESIDINDINYLNRYEKRRMKKLRKNFQAKVYQREKRQDYLQEVYELQAEKAMLEKELEIITRERDQLWNLELGYLRAL
ncbi:hypothetical protein LOD99_792 [Oopsacas minuta]|uniref:BZIP domain-containing protein n=1 Tax=Oopsacas minuta TaxID=111878 RepID=A0AAV7K0V5_9METZ|nr:hypothetical protein LOD99_792 [Oopsacas minuta]